MASIVILEDDTTLSKQLAAMLELDGHAVACFETVPEALAYFGKESADLVIADLFIRDAGQTLPQGGITLISRIRQIMNSRVPIIAISGSFGPTQSGRTEMSSKTVGATAVLGKPFHPDELSDLVNDLLKKAGPGQT